MTELEQWYVRVSVIAFVSSEVDVVVNLECTGPAWWATSSNWQDTSITHLL